MNDYLDPTWSEFANKDGKVKPEDIRYTADKEIDFIGNVYSDFYKYRTFRSGAIRHFQDYSFEDMLRVSRELFWNANVTSSEDLAAIGLEFSIPFTRKEVMDFVGRMVSLGIKPRISGDTLDAYGIKVLNSLYQRWRFKSNDKVEKFWQLLYGVVNGTTCLFVGYNNQEKTQRFLREYDPANGGYRVEEKKKKYWDDVETSIVPIEDIYLSKIYERNIQKQGKVIWKSQMEPADFHREFQKYPDNIYVLPGKRIAEDSLYYRLLGGTGVTTTNKIEVLRIYDTDNDQYGIVANGIHLNKLGKDGQNYNVAPLPFDHKMQPFVWGINEAVDEKIAYGLPMPFKVKDPHKILNTQYVMLIERELRTIDKPILSSDIETPPVIFGEKRIIPVNDINAYKEIDIAPASTDYFTTMNSMQSIMTGMAQGGMATAIPSIQPKSAAEVDSINQAKQQAMGTALLMYYDMLRQEIMLVLKTMLQFYTAGKYAKDETRIVKTLMVPNMPLSLGGTGDMEVRIVKKTMNALDLYYESIQKAIQNGKMTEILEVPVDLLQNLEFEISSIDLEPEETSEMKKAMFIQSVIMPMLQTYVPAGIADISKVYLRHLEALGEHPADYSSSNMLPQIMQSWGTQYPNLNLGANKGNQPTGAPRSTIMGNMQQSVQGQANGAASNGGQGATPFTSPQMNPMQQNMPQQANLNPMQ